jgi:HK97 family phage portal protein
MAMESFGSLFFGQGTHPGAVVSHPKKLSPEAHQNLQASLEKAHSGLGKSHRLLLLEEGMKIEDLGVSPEDSQFLQSRQFGVTEIARWYNLPPHKLKDLTRSSFNNIESEQLSYVGESILPWLVRLEQAYNSQILTEKQAYQQNIYFNHVVEGLLRADSEARGNFYQLCIQNAIMTPNEARSKENMNPSDNPLADELWMMSNVVPVSHYNEMNNQNKGDSNAPGPPNRQANRKQPLRRAK